MLDFLNLQPANLSLEDMVGANIEYVYTKPSMSPPITEVGTIIALRQVNGLLHMYVVPHNEDRLPKWRTEDHFIRYIHPSKKAIA